MAKRILNEQSILDVLCGATILGGGGGGPMSAGLTMLDNYKKAFPGKPLEITLIDSAEMEDNAYAAVICGMGSPKKVLGVDFSPYVVNAFNALKKHVASMKQPKELKYALAVEMGGFTTCMPILISLMEGLPLMDADGAGRAVPGLDTLLFDVYGLDASPLAFADGDGNEMLLLTKNPKNASFSEEVGRALSATFDGKVGLCGWTVGGKDIDACLAIGSITLAERIGAIVRECMENNTPGEVFRLINERGVAKARQIINGKVTKFFNDTKGGFDYGYFIVTDDDGNQWRTEYQNENLLLSRLDGEKRIPVMTVPEVIATYDPKTGTPLTNAAIEEGMDIALGAIKVHEAWWGKESAFTHWKPYLERVEYTGGAIRFEELA